MEYLRNIRSRGKAASLAGKNIHMLKLNKWNFSRLLIVCSTVWV